LLNLGQDPKSHRNSPLMLRESLKSIFVAALMKRRCSCQK